MFKDAFYFLEYRITAGAIDTHTCHFPDVTFILARGIARRRIECNVIPRGWNALREKRSAEIRLMRAYVESRRRVLWVINMIESSGVRPALKLSFRGRWRAQCGERAVREGDSRRTMGWSTEGAVRLLAGLLRAINKCRCQHPPLDPRLSHVSSLSFSLVPLSIAFSLSPSYLASLFLLPFLSAYPLSRTPRGSFPCSLYTLVDTTRGEKKKNLSLPTCFLFELANKLCNRIARKSQHRQRWLRNDGCVVCLLRPAFRKRCRRER